MASKTQNKPTVEMNGYELALNNCFVRQHEAMYRDYSQEVKVDDFIVAVCRNLGIDEEDIPSGDGVATIMCDWMEEEYTSLKGIVALLYEMMWSKAELYEALQRREDADDPNVEQIIQLVLRGGEVVSVEEIEQTLVMVSPREEAEG